MIAYPLTVRDKREHDFPKFSSLWTSRSLIGAAGIAVLSEAVRSRTKLMRLFCACASSLWVAGREEPQGSPLLQRYCNFRSVAHPIAVGLAVKNRNWSIIMAKAPKAAIHPKILTFSTLEKRIRRKLALDSLALQHTRHGSLIRAENGEWITVDPRTNSILRRHFTLPELAYELGLIAADEQIEGGN